MSVDWNVLSACPSFSNTIIRKVDLWRYLSCRSIGLEEFGKVFASEVAAQDSDPYLIGYSMGGRLALHAIEAAPTLWKGVMLISAHPGLSSSIERQERLTKDTEWGALALSRDWKIFLKKWNDQQVLGVLPESLSDRCLLQPRAQEIARAFCVWSLGNQRDMREKFITLDCPVALVTGEHDRKFTQLASEIQFQNSKQIVIPDSGHRALWESPKIACDYMHVGMEFLRGD